MIVLHVMPDHELGGGGVMISRLVHAFHDAGQKGRHKVMLPENADARSRQMFADLPHEFGEFPGRGSVWKMARAMVRRVGKGDVVHAHGSRAAMAATLAKAMRPGLKTVYTVHGFHGLAQPGPLGLRVKIEHGLARAMDATAFVSQADAALAREHGLKHRGPAEVIENGLAVPDPAPSAPRDIDILFVGRMVYQKWPQAFVETMGRLQSALPTPPRIVMVGAGEMAAEIDGMVSAVGLTDFTRHDGLPPAETVACMGRAKVMVMTSRWEGLPTVAIEAAIAGALVMGFDIPPLREILAGADVADACLTDPDPEALAKRLAEVLSDDALRLSMAEPLQARTRDHYSPERMAARYSDLYERISA